MNLKHFLIRCMAPAGDDGADAGGAGTGAADTAVLDDDTYLSLSEEERSRMRGDVVGGTVAATPSPAMG